MKSLNKFQKRFKLKNQMEKFAFFKFLALHKWGTVDTKKKKKLLT